MMVKDKIFVRRGAGVEDVPTQRLIELGGYDSDRGQIEDLEARVDQLTKVLAALIDRSGLPADEVLRITGTDYRFEVVEGDAS